MSSGYFDDTIDEIQVSIEQPTIEVSLNVEQPLIEVDINGMSIVYDLDEDAYYTKNETDFLLDGKLDITAQLDGGVF